MAFANIKTKSGALRARLKVNSLFERRGNDGRIRFKTIQGEFNEIKNTIFSELSPVDRV